MFISDWFVIDVDYDRSLKYEYKWLNQSKLKAFTSILYTVYIVYNILYYRWYPRWFLPFKLASWFINYETLQQHSDEVSFGMVEQDSDDVSEEVSDKLSSRCKTLVSR